MKTKVKEHEKVAGEKLIKLHAFKIGYKKGTSTVDQY